MNKIYSDSFDSFDNYWFKAGEAAWVADNRLYQKADPQISGDGAVEDEGGVSTIWCRTPFPSDVEIRVKVCVVSSVVGANNITYFCPMRLAMVKRLRAREMNGLMVVIHITMNSMATSLLFSGIGNTRANLVEKIWMNRLDTGCAAAPALSCSLRNTLGSASKERFKT